MPRLKKQKENIQEILNKYCGGKKATKLNSKMPKGLKGGAYNDELDDIQNQVDILSQTDYEKLPAWERSKFYEALKGIEQQLLDLSDKYPEDDFVTGVRLQEVRDLQKKVAPQVKKLPPLPAPPKKFLDEEKEFEKFKNKDYIPSNKKTISNPNPYGEGPIKLFPSPKKKVKSLSKLEYLLDSLQEGEVGVVDFKKKPKAKKAPKKTLIPKVPKASLAPKTRKAPKEKVANRDRKFHPIDYNGNIIPGIYKGDPRAAAKKVFTKLYGSQSAIVKIVEATPGYNQKIFAYQIQKIPYEDEEIEKMMNKKNPPLFIPKHKLIVKAIKII